MSILTTLTSFHTDSRLHDLAALLHRPKPFNILTALGLGRQELRHSDLLALLLDPNQSHGLGDCFVRILLRRAAALATEQFDPDTLQLEPLAVRREWKFIDILIESPADRLVIIVENKIDTSEHSDQLGRYYKLVAEYRPGWRVIGIYLTLDGTPPVANFDRDRYIPIGYSDVAATLSDLAGDEQTAPDVRALLRHYAQLIRSELVPEPDTNLARLGRRLYVDHRAALDTMLQARDERMRMIQRHIQGLFAATRHEQPGLLSLDKPHTNNDLPRQHLRFAPSEWYVPELQVSTSWTKTGLILVFEFMHAPQQIHLSLTVGPARSAESLRRSLYDLAQRRIGVLHPIWNDPSNEWFSIYARDVFPYGSDFFAEESDDAIRAAIREHWHVFLQEDLPAIRAAIRDHILLHDQLAGGQSE